MAVQHDHHVRTWRLREGLKALFKLGDISSGAAAFAAGSIIGWHFAKYMEEPKPPRRRRPRPTRLRRRRTTRRRRLWRVKP